MLCASLFRTGLAHDASQQLHAIRCYTGQACRPLPLPQRRLRGGGKGEEKVPARFRFEKSPTRLKPPAKAVHFIYFKVLIPGATRDVFPFLGVGGGQGRRAKLLDARSFVSRFRGFIGYRGRKTEALAPRPRVRKQDGQSNCIYQAFRTFTHNNS